MEYQKTNNREKTASLCREGQLTLEIIIAMAILTISLAAVIVVIFGGQSLLVDTRESNQALFLARQNLEEVQAGAKNDWSGIVHSSSTEGEFLKEIIVSSTDSHTKLVTSRVSWQTDPLRVQNIELTSVITDWVVSNASGGDTGGGGTSGDWQNPQTLGSIDLGPGNSATDLDVLNKIVYLSSTASDSKKPDFYVADVTDGQNPQIVANLNTGPGANALDVAGNYVYVANNDVNAQLQVIDVNNYTAPAFLVSFKLPGVSGSGAVGNTVFYQSGRVYVGTKRATGPEFYIIDVSDPSGPLTLGSFEINGDVNSIVVRNDEAYLSISPNDELRILDISNPSSVSLIGNYDAPGDSEDGKSLSIAGNKLYLGRLLGGNHADHHELHVIDVSSPSALQNLGSRDIAADINDLRIINAMAFLGTNDPNKEFQIWNISNPENIVFLSNFNFPQVASGIDYEDNVVYVSVRSNDALRIITSSP